SILSIFINRQKAFEIKFFSPDMLHSISVRSRSGLKVNSVRAVEAKGRMNSSLSLIKSFGRLSVIVIRPSPALSLPDQAKIEPVPAVGPSKVFLAAGSSFAHGDHASHL